MWHELTLYDLIASFATSTLHKIFYFLDSLNKVKKNKRGFLLLLSIFLLTRLSDFHFFKMYPLCIVVSQVIVLSLPAKPTRSLFFTYHHIPPVFKSLSPTKISFLIFRLMLNCLLCGCLTGNLSSHDLN